MFDLAAEAGFDAVEVLVDHRWDSRHPTYLRHLSDRSGLPIVALHSPFKPFLPGWPHDPLGRLRKTAAVARDVGTGLVVAHLPLRIGGARIEFFGFARAPLLLPIPLSGEREYRSFLLDGLAQFEAEEGVQVGVENMPAKPVLGRKMDIHWLNKLESWEQMPHLTLDTTHLGTWGRDLLEVYERLKERIIHVHLANFDGKEHRLPENGHLPLGELLRRLTRDGYKGAVSLEVGPEVLEAEHETLAQAHLRRALDFCREGIQP